MYIHSNIIGIFALDLDFKIIDEHLYKGTSDYENREALISEFLKKHKDLKTPEPNELSKILLAFKDEKYLKEFYEKNILLTKDDVKASVNDDLLLIHSVKTIWELERCANLLAKRLREWYEVYNPEASRSIESHEVFAETILTKGKDELLSGLGIDSSYSFGADIGEENLSQIMEVAKTLDSIYKLRKKNLEYISSIMDKLCPNVKAVCDVIVGAKLIECAGSLKRLSQLPASTIQILGAETALFRHMKTGAKSPKHGVIIGHPLIANSPYRMHGKIARSLADKICIAAKIDFFKGEFIGNELRKKLDEKFSNRPSK